MPVPAPLIRFSASTCCRLASLATVLAITAGCAQTPPPPPQASANPTLEVRAVAWDESRLERLRDAMPALLQTHGVAGAAVGFVGDGRLQWAEGYGTTSPAGQPMEAETLFPVSGLREPVLAALTLTVSRQRPWSLHTPLADIAPQLAWTSDNGRLTPKQLLSHTADGSRGWHESPAGYDRLIQALESAERAPLPRLTADHVFTAAGMSSSRMNASSTLVTSAKDYATFLQWLLSEEQDPSTLATLLGVQTTVDRERGLYWGLGWGLERRADTGLTAFHWGTDPRFTHLALLDPVRKRGLVILTNAEQGLGLLTDAVAILDEEPHTLFDFDSGRPAQ